ncbi:ATP-binding protein [Edaphobacter bradus]|uniref:hypothetical protein n=1 Tax=Edaphobacter bradus TaxID=2259016 RepID=UPI0021DFBFC0|nr:hypothetical protein [Edaphobacter bradus]
MNRVTVDLENCYGIKKLGHRFDFSTARAYSIYAPNGSMKSSFASVFRDISQGKKSKDNIFPARVSKSEVKDELGADLPEESVVAVRPYSDEFGQSTKTATLLVNNALRKEYEELYKDIDAAKERLLTSLKHQSGSKKNLEQELSSTFTKDNNFETALTRIRSEVAAMKDAPFKDVKYDKIFNDKVIDALGKGDVKTVIDEYIRKYNELLAASTYFRKGIFNYHQASTIAKSLADNGFFEAKHTVHLNATETLEITSQKQLEDLIQKEKDSITKDVQLRKKFSELDKLLYKNETVREFNSYLSEDDTILPQLGNIELFREVLWKNYLKAHFELYSQYLDTCEAAKEKRLKIEEAARTETTQWEEVINIFNERFFVPFKLDVENRTQAILGEEILVLKFTFRDGNENAPVQRNELLKVLSTGEAKALYILDIIFEIQVRRKTGTETLLVVDDIADSFDYKNKYAIIEYLREISEDPTFKLIILTHNFDFFRTLESRSVVPYKNCLMALKKADGLSLTPLTGFRNVFVNDWKNAFFTDPKKRIASIAFLRNMVEYTKGENDPDYLTLTSLLHLKSNSATITQEDLDTIYNRMFGGTSRFSNPTQKVIGWIHGEAKKCLGAAEGINFENKVVLSIAIRLAAEEYMTKKINDPPFVAGIGLKQTTALLKKFIDKFPAEIEARKGIEQVLLMTPENIHLNSFMYEPILDMSDDHLRKLYTKVLNLK